MTTPGIPNKPLGIKAYGSICHLPGSRLGPGDHKLNEGQARILTEKTRDKHDVIIVQEKLDGSNVAIAKVNGAIVALGRSGYLAQTSKYEQHQLFAAWVRGQGGQGGRFDFLAEGERLCGEWLAQAHGTRYQLIHEPFVAFDLMNGTTRSAYEPFLARVSAANLVVPKLLSVGPPVTIERALAMLEHEGINGFHGAIDPVEGAVWRVERKGVVDFLGKYVRPEKKDGSYLPEISGQEAVWNWRP
jgi:RNA ligase